jgi:hypothetical protein
MTAWKEAERFIAAALGGSRVPVTGRQRGDVPDIEHPRFAIEVKRRATAYAFPKWLETAFDQAQACNPGDKTPIVVIQHAQGRGKPSQYFVMLALNDFAELVVSDDD